MILVVAALALMLAGPALATGNNIEDGLASADTSIATEQQTEQQTWNSGNLIFVKRLEDGSYTPTSFSLLLLVMAAIFIVKRRRRKKK
jgi:hypothetical protein